MKKSILFFICFFLNNVLTQPQAQENTNALEISNPSSKTTSWGQYKREKNKAYNSPNEDIYRGVVFEKNKKKINNHNKKEKKQRKYNLQMNDFADLTEEEFAAYYTTLIPSDNDIRTTARNIRQRIDLQKEKCSCDEQYVKKKDKIDKQLKKNLPKIKKVVFSQFKEKKVKKIKIKKDQEDFGKKKLSKQDQQLVQKLTQEYIFDAKNRRLQQISNLTNIDWTNRTGSVRHQGICGACYALVPVQNFQFLLAKYVFPFYIELSAQQIVDCDFGFSLGCDGGYFEGAFNFMQMQGVQTNFAYPYQSDVTGVSDICKRETGQFKIKSYQSLPSGDCQVLRQVLMNKPVSVGISAANLQFYSQGVFDGCDDNIDHAVLLVGFDNAIGWKFKNTWGLEWGMQGFGFISIENNCRICDLAVVPNIEQEPETIEFEGSANLTENLLTTSSFFLEEQI